MILSGKVGREGGGTGDGGRGSEGGKSDARGRPCFCGLLSMWSGGFSFLGILSGLGDLWMDVDVDVDGLDDLRVT